MAGPLDCGLAALVGLDGSVVSDPVPDVLTLEWRTQPAGQRGIQEVAGHSPARYIDLYRTFQGETGDSDDAELLAPDGNYPSQAGHLQNAEFLASVGYAPLRCGP